MPNLKEVRNRIESVKSTQQITSAMKLVAASKLRKAQNAIMSLRPYSKKMSEILQNVSASIDSDGNSVYGQQRPEEKILIVALASNRGLCGAFNSNVIKLTRRLIFNTFAPQHAKGNVHLICAGKHLSDYFVRQNFGLHGRFDAIFDKPEYQAVADIATGIMKAFESKKYDAVYLVYNQFKNAATQTLITEQFLPIAPSKEKTATHSADYIFQPDKNEILDDLVPRSLKIQLYKAVLDSFASEQGARMTAMHQATDNAKEILRQLKLAYNKARQNAITSEILEIVGGANALKSS
ncbi:MAG: ATP synthase F1 subunit gamma [Bacteroidales bacterium]|jgi:F-type H+-transporting ATPase subunit gamma|nr:ATP synthase F1 subunit gamma [Bacteroidales bacterium]